MAPKVESLSSIERHFRCGKKQTLNAINQTFGEVNKLGEKTFGACKKLNCPDKKIQVNKKTSLRNWYFKGETAIRVFGQLQHNKV